MGNLTNITAGLTLNPSDATQFGLEVNLANRTSDKSGVNTVSPAYGAVFTTPATSTDKPTATVVGLTANHNYGHGLSMMAGMNYIMLGNYYKPTGASVGNAIALDLAAKYSF
jgi:hypothetical protein